LVLVALALPELVTLVQVQYLVLRPPQVVAVVDQIQLRQQQAQMVLVVVVVISQMVEQQLVAPELQTTVVTEVAEVVQMQLQVVVAVQAALVFQERQLPAVLAELEAHH
jgi:hypothetical protein